MNKKLKTVLGAVCVLLVLNTVFVFSVGAVIFNVALKGDGNTGAVNADEKNWLERESEDIYILGDGDIQLHGYYVENPDFKSRYALICHGYGDNGAGMSYYAKQFYMRGYSVLVPDARCHGESGGKIIGMGYVEKTDIIDWINEITKRDKNARVVLFGVSMGGATVLFTSGEESLPDSVGAVVSDCAYTDVYNEIGSAIRYALPWVPSFPIIDCASVVCEISGGYNLKKASCVEAVKRSDTPTLFIHGSADRYVPFEMLGELYESCAAEKQRLVIEGAEHAASARTDKELYWKTVESFLSEYIK